jgi:hypothetical protein
MFFSGPLCRGMVDQFTAEQMDYFAAELRDQFARNLQIIPCYFKCKGYGAS